MAIRHANTERSSGATRVEPAPEQADEPVATRAPGATGRGPSVASARPDVAHQRDEFGGLNWGAAFFGWLVAVGIAAILTAFLSAAGAAIGLTNISSDEARKNAATIGLGGGIALLIVVLTAYYAGGYVAGRMSRFDGGRQGFGAWLIGAVITVLFGAAGAIFGAKYNVFGALNLPRIPSTRGPSAPVPRSR
jgi:hypothetical protein